MVRDGDITVKDEFDGKGLTLKANKYLSDDEKPKTLYARETTRPTLASERAMTGRYLIDTES